ncbi:MAG TPA: hypothetical protein PKE45_22345, partial [Caldilineaceae bacterium]|nr:hypothetical protein [Caldilineaceae bacterium]
MTNEQFSQAILDALALPADACYTQFSALHTQLYTAYRTAVGRLSAEEVMAPVSGPGDPRTLAQVVGHIAAWDRFSTQAAGDILGGVTHPRAITSVEGFIDQEGRLHNFRGVDEFNAFFARQQAHLAWLPLQLEAIDAATTLHALFTQPELLTGKRLART